MFKKFSEYLRQRLDEEMAIQQSNVTPTVTQKKATAQATAQALKRSPIDIEKNRNNPHALNKLRASALMNIAKNPSISAVPNVTAIDNTIGVDDEPTM